MQLFTKIEDLQIVQLAYTDCSFEEIGRKLNRPSFAVFFHTKNRFGTPRCDLHYFDVGCEKCQENRKIWEKNALEVIENTDYTKNQWKLYTQAEDNFIIDQAYGKLSFTEISEFLGRTAYSAHIRMKSQFGLPRCDLHDIFDNKCPNCLESLKKWKINSKKKIETMKYSPDFYDEEKLLAPKENKRRKNILERTSHLKELIPEDIYEDIIDFILHNPNLIMGRDTESIFVQSTRLFLTDYIQALDLATIIPYEILDFFYSNEPNPPLIAVIQPIYKQFVNPNYHPLHDIVVKTLRDIKNLAKIYPKKTCGRLWIILCLLNIKYGNEWANLAAIIDICKKKPDSITLRQEDLAEMFETTDVTIRTRKKQLKSKNFPENLFTFMDQNIIVDDAVLWDIIKEVPRSPKFKQILADNFELINVITQYISTLEKKHSILSRKYIDIIKELEESSKDEKSYDKIPETVVQQITKDQISLNACIAKAGLELYNQLIEESQTYLQTAFILLNGENPLLYALGILQLCKIIELEITLRIIFPIIEKIKNNELSISFNRPYVELLSENEKKRIEQIEKDYSAFCNMIKRPQNITLGVIPSIIGRLANPEKYSTYTDLFVRISDYLRQYITHDEILILKQFLLNEKNLLQLPPNETLSSLRNYVAHPFNKEFRDKITITRTIFEHIFDIITFEEPKVLHILIKLPKKQ